MPILRDFLASLDADKIIPGHGPLSGKKEVAEMKAYLGLFDSKAKELAAKGGTPEEIAARMKGLLPVMSRGEWIIGANLQGRYLAQ